jgi:hydroxymethylglutaryl-CoA lyase
MKSKDNKSSESKMKAQKSVRIVEVGLRDGLQNEAHYPEATIRKELLLQLIDAGAKSLEVGAFVSPKWVPAMACSVALTEDVLRDQRNKLIAEDIQLSVLVPNEKGMEKAIELGV